MKKLLFGLAIILATCFQAWAQRQDIRRSGSSGGGSGGGSSLWTNNAGVLQPFPAVNTFFINDGDYTVVEIDAVNASQIADVFVGTTNNAGATSGVFIAADPNNTAFGTGIVIKTGPIFNTVIVPGKPDGTTPYQFGTSVAHTSGDLFAVTNLTTKAFAVAYDGSISTGNTNTLKFTGFKSCTAMTMIVTNYLELVVNGVTNNVLIGSPTP